MSLRVNAVFKPNTQKQSGFTIVELLIVIVIIGILASLVIVAYNGIQNRAKTQSAQASASVIQKKIEAYNADQGSYPTSTSNTAYIGVLNAQTVSSISATGITLSTPTTATLGNEKRAQVSLCTIPTGATGYQIGYWDFATNVISTTFITGNTNSIPCTTYTPLT